MRKTFLKFFIIFGALFLMLLGFNNCSNSKLESSLINSSIENSSNSIADDNDQSSEDNSGNEVLPAPPVSEEKANLIYYQDFEKNYEGINISSNATVVNVNSHTGSYSLRGNLMSGRLDPYTNRKGGGTLTSMNKMGIENSTPNEVYVRYWFRFDDAHWIGENNPNPEGLKVDLKMGYLDSKKAGLSETQAAFYPVFQGGENGELNIGDNLGDRVNSSGTTWANWSQKEWGWRNSTNSPTGLLYGQTGHSFGADGKWHLFEMHIEYNVTSEYHHARIFVDGHVMKSGKNAPDSRGGRFRLPKEFHLDQFNFFYTGARNTRYSKDRTGYACGVQVDDIEVWDAMPERYKK